MDRRTLLTAGALTLASACAPGRQSPTAREGFAKVPGGRVWWRKVGDGQRTPLLALHGGPGAAHGYLTSLEALADQRPVILYDQLGCGKSDAPKDRSLWTIGRSCDEIDALRGALGLKQVILLGHSWGGWLALEYMATRPSPHVEALVLSSTSASTAQFVAGARRLLDAMPNGAGAKIRALEAEGNTQGKAYGNLVKAFYARHLLRGQPFPPGPAPDDTDVYQTMNGPNEFTVVGNLRAWDRSPDLARIKTPTLITTGEFDEFTLDCAQTLHRGIAGSKLAVLKGASHLYSLEQPAAYDALIRDFLGDKA